MSGVIFNNRHSSGKQPESRHGGRQHGYSGETDRDPRQQDEEHAIAAQAIGGHAADGAEEAADENDDGGEIAGLHLADVILIAEENGEIAGEADEAAEGDAVNEAESPRVGFFQNAGVSKQRFHNHGRERLEAYRNATGDRILWPVNMSPLNMWRRYTPYTRRFFEPMIRTSHSPLREEQ